MLGVKVGRRVKVARAWVDFEPERAAPTWGMFGVKVGSRVKVARAWVDFEPEREAPT